VALLSFYAERRGEKMKRICAYCGEKIFGYPHVTVWDEQPRKSEGLRFHTISEAILFFSEDKLSKLIDKWNAAVIPLRQEQEPEAASAVKACAVELEAALYSFCTKGKAEK